MTKVDLGDRVIAVVDPAGNDGNDIAPATVTALGKTVDGRQSITAVAHLVDGSTKVLTCQVFDDRAAVDAWLDEQLEHIPPQQDGHGPRRPAEREDVLRWLSAVYVPGKTKTSAAAAASSTSTGS